MGKIIQKDLRQLLSFNVTGHLIEDGVKAIAGEHMVPALLSQYRNLSQLRHDFPMVLMDKAEPVAFSSLSHLINTILQKIAPSGIDGEAMRKQVLGLEKEIRKLIVPGKRESLSRVWDKAAKKLANRLGRNAKAKQALKTRLDLAKTALTSDGTVIGCDAHAAQHIVCHAWHALLEGRHAGLLTTLRDLAINLKGVLDADFMKTDKALEPKALQASVGSSFEDEIDFAAMKQVLKVTMTNQTMPSARRKRIQHALDCLVSQDLIASTPAPGRNPSRHPLVMDSCEQAVAFFQKRQKDLVDLVKAMRIARLEIDNRYRPEKHDAVFAEFQYDDLTDEEAGLFPTLLVCQNPKKDTPANKAALVEILSSDLPIKIFIESQNVLPNGQDDLQDNPFSGWRLNLAHMAAGLHNAFVLQTTTSNLQRVCQRIHEGLSGHGPALFHVFHGNAKEVSDVNEYLISAAAQQSRVFPTFEANPKNGNELADRFTVFGNPQPEAIWPSDPFSYQDQDLQGKTEMLAFTPVDFMACDHRFSDQFAVVRADHWHANMVPAADLLNGKAHDAEKIPFIWMVDANQNLHRVITTRKVVEFARRYGASWRTLQEMAGIDNSHALRLLEQARQAWEEEKQQEIDQLKQSLEPQAPSPAKAAPDAAAAKEAPAEAEAEAEGPSDEAFIETPRCTSCNECIDKNNRMFKYNENKQAYIADVKAGTFKELVEAAEKCPVCIIHTGIPWNPDEPNLEDLVKRAEAFR